MKCSNCNADVTPETGGMADQAEWYEKGWRAGQAAAETGGVLDRDRAGDVLGDLFDWCEAQAAGAVFDLTYWLDRLAAAVRPAAIDRDALVMLLDGWEAPQPLHLADAILALVRPVAGVVLSPEEADDLEAVLQLGLDVYMDSARGPRLRALAARLEAES